MPSVNFESVIGPLYWQGRGGSRPNEPKRYAFQANEQHRNARGVLHGSVTAGAFDIALRDISCDAVGKEATTAVHITVQYLRPIEIGSFVVIEAEVVSKGRTMVFAHGRMFVRGEVVATADWTGKILGV